MVDKPPGLAERRGRETIISCYFHSWFQKNTLPDGETGEIEERRLEHESGEASTFYRELKQPVLGNMDSTGYAIRFAEMLSEFGHQLVVGDAARIRAQVVRKPAIRLYVMLRDQID